MTTIIDTKRDNKKGLEKEHSNKAALFTLFLIVFLDMVGVGIIIPILPSIFYGNAFFPLTLSENARNILLGFLIAAYPIAQFFSAPVLGRLSDKYGRKKILIISLIGTFFSYILFALGIVFSNIYLLFLSRVLDGITGGNISVATSAISDLSDKKTKMKNFGLIGMAVGLGFILGPFIGGKLTDQNLVSWFNLSTPFWFAACLVVLNIIFVIVFLRETIKQKVDKKISMSDGINNIKNAFAIKELRLLFLIIFLANFGWAFFTQFFQVYLYHRFDYSPSQIGSLFAYVGLWIAITQGFLIRVISSRFSSESILRISLILTPIILSIITLQNNPNSFYIFLPLMAVFFGLVHPSFSVILSDSADDQSQGEIMGMRQSLLSLSQALPPLLAGAALSLGESTPLILASITIAVSWIIFLFYKNNGTVHSL